MREPAIGRALVEVPGDVGPREPSRRAPGREAVCAAPECAAWRAAGEACLTSGELTRRRAGDTCRLALPILERFAARFEGADAALSFMDAEGWRMWAGGDGAALGRLAAAGLAPGTGCRRAAALCRSDGLEAGGEREAPRRTWRCSGEVVAPAEGERAGVVCAGEPGGALLATCDIARAVAERLRLARLVREHVIRFALDAATAAGEGLLGLDAAARIFAANTPARVQLGLEGTEPPLAPARALAAALAPPAAGRREIAVAWAGGGAGPTLLVTPIRYEQDVVGAVARVIPGREARRRRGGRAASPPRVASTRYDFDQILGEAPAIRAAIGLARTAARNDLPVVLSGESGTGKELFTQAIHAASGRRAGPFIAVNCGCIPSGLREAELFGYEPGTFTGGRPEGRPGKFEEAAGGTIFLDEVSELSPEAQTALLRVLQEREVVRLGGSAPRPVDIRVIAASNKPLPEEVRVGRFRGDLYFRLHVMAIAVPALRERRQDVPLLARRFLAESEAEVGRAGLSFSEAALRALREHAWPGNVRELRNAVLRSAATAAGPVIDAADLRLEVEAVAPQPRAAPEPERAAGRPEQAEKRQGLVRALEATSWNVARTAQSLGVSRMTLYRWLRKLDVALSSAPRARPRVSHGGAAGAGAPLAAPPGAERP